MCVFLFQIIFNKSDNYNLNLKLSYNVANMKNKFKQIFMIYK